MSSYAKRDRLTEADARQKLANTESNMVQHLCLNEDDGSFSIMAHIVCEHCDYCDEQDDASLRVPGPNKE